MNFYYIGEDVVEISNNIPTTSKKTKKRKLMKYENDDI